MSPVQINSLKSFSFIVCCMSASVANKSVESKVSVLGSCGKYAFMISIFLFIVFIITACILDDAGDTSVACAFKCFGTATNMPLFGLPVNLTFVAGLK